MVKCVNGHRAPVHRDFMVWLIHELREKHLASIPGGNAKGIFLKSYRCACGGELAAQPARQEWRAFELAFEGHDAFRFAVELALHACPACGKEQVRSAADLARTASGMVVRLHDALGFPHSG